MMCCGECVCWCFPIPHILRKSVTERPHHVDYISESGLKVQEKTGRQWTEKNSMFSISLDCSTRLALVSTSQKGNARTRNSMGHFEVIPSDVRPIGGSFSNLSGVGSLFSPDLSDINLVKCCRTRRSHLVPNSAPTRQLYNNKRKKGSPEFNLPAFSQNRCLQCK